MERLSVHEVEIEAMGRSLGKISEVESVLADMQQLVKDIQGFDGSQLTGRVHGIEANMHTSLTMQGYDSDRCT